MAHKGKKKGGDQARKEPGLPNGFPPTSKRGGLTYRRCKRGVSKIEKRGWLKDRFRHGGGAGWFARTWGGG